MATTNFPQTDSITRHEYEALRGNGDRVEEVTNQGVVCVVCGAEISPERLRQKAKTCSPPCGEVYKRQRQKELDARRGPRLRRRARPALEVRSVVSPVGDIPVVEPVGSMSEPPPDRLTNLVVQLVGAGQRVSMEVDGVTLVVG
jgi:hypothetical protein